MANETYILSWYTNGNRYGYVEIVGINIDEQEEIRENAKIEKNQEKYSDYY